MQSPPPKVSVIIPNYNHARYLPQRIESVLQQTYDNIEVLLLDDCSPDNSREVIAQYAAQDARIRVVLNEQNSGSTFKQWNKGIALAKGEYIWIAESDDYAEPDFLETLLSRFQANPQVGLAYSQSFSVDGEGQPLVIGRPTLPAPTWEPFYDDLDSELWKHDFMRPGIELVSRFMSYRNIVPNASAVLLRRSTLAQVGPAAGSFRVVGDWLFWAKVMAVCEVAFIARPLNYFRAHRNNVRTKTSDDGTALIEVAQLLLAMRQYGNTADDMYQKAIEQLLATWFDSFVHRQIPLAQHRKVYKCLTALEPGLAFQVRLLRALRSLLIRNQFHGLRALIKYKVLRVAPSQSSH